MILPAGDSRKNLVLKVPTSFSELRAVRRTLGLYQQECPLHVALLLLTTYLFMQVLKLCCSHTASLYDKYVSLFQFCQRCVQVALVLMSHMAWMNIWVCIPGCCCRCLCAQGPRSCVCWQAACMARPLPCLSSPWQALWGPAAASGCQRCC